MLTNEQTEETKRKIIEHINTNFPEDKKEQATQKIGSMNAEQLEQFLEKNGMLRQGEGSGCIFCSIASGKSESYKIAENENAVAVLEINPISEGHILVLPKEHIQLKEIPQEIKSFSQQVGKKLQKKLSPKDVEIATLDFGGHGVINLIPVYNSENIKSERHHATKRELEEVITKLAEQPEDVEQKTETIEKSEDSNQSSEEQEEITDENTWLPKRIP